MNEKRKFKVDPENKRHRTQIEMGISDLKKGRAFGHSMVPNRCYIYGWRMQIHKLRAYRLRVDVRNKEAKLNNRPTVSLKQYNYLISHSTQLWKEATKWLK